MPDRKSAATLRAGALLVLAAACASGPIRTGGDRPGWTSQAGSDPRCGAAAVCAVGTASVGEKGPQLLLSSLDAAARAEVAAALASTVSAEVRSYERVRTGGGKEETALDASQRVSQVVKEFDLTPAIAIADRWREGDIAWALAVLDKAKAVGLQQGKIADRMRLAQELVGQGDEKATAAPGEALRLYARARTEADAALAGVLLLRALGGKADLSEGAARAEGRFSALAGRLALAVASGDGQRVAEGKALPAPVVFSALLDGQPVAGLPLEVAVPGGRAEGSVQTGPDGRAAVRVADVGRFAKPDQRITASVDWRRLVGAEKAPAWAAAARREAAAVALKKSLETTRVLVLLRETIEGGAAVTGPPVQAAMANALKAAGLDVKDARALVEKLGGEAAAAAAGDARTKEEAKAFGDVLVLGTVTSRHAGSFGAKTVWHRARADVRVIDLSTGQVLQAFADEEKGERPGLVDVAGRSALEALAKKLAPAAARAVAAAAQ